MLGQEQMKLIKYKSGKAGQWPRSKPGILNKIKKILAPTAIVLLMAGCKVVIVVPEGGKVLSDNGIECLAGQTCVLNIDHTNFDDRFHAVPDEGYVFEQWQATHGYFCGGASIPCHLITTGMAGIAVFEEVLATDFEFFMIPEFSGSAPEPIDTPSRYDVAEWANFLAELNSSTHRSNTFLYQSVPDTGSCDPGVLKSQAKSRFTYALNLIRKLHHLPAVQYDDFYSAEMQQAALVQLANNYLTHSPRSTDDCYTAAAASGSGSSNLSSSSIQRDVAYYPIGWANDNRNISSLMAAGHRRWLLYPQLGYTSYGQTAGYSSMKVFGFGQTPATSISPDVEFIAFPYKAYPHVLVSRGSSPTPWSLSMVPPSGGSSSHDYFQSASVVVRETASNTALSVTSLYHDTKGYGLRNFLSWMVSGWNHDTDYTVTISNIRMPDSSVREIEYQVRIDLEPLR